MTYYQESIEEARRSLRRFFIRKELRSKVARNPVTLESIIRKYHQLHYRERYPFGVPGNLIQLNYFNLPE